MSSNYISREMDDLVLAKAKMQEGYDKLERDWEELRGKKREVLEKFLPHLTNADIIHVVTTMLLTEEDPGPDDIASYLLKDSADDNTYDCAAKTYAYLSIIDIQAYGIPSLEMLIWRVKHAIESLEQ